MKMLRNKKGNILVFSYFVIALLMVFGATFISRMLTEIRACDTFVKNAQAFHAAEIALADACWRYDYHLPLPEGNIVIDDGQGIFARIEHVDPTFASFSIRTIGFVADEDSSVVAKRLVSTGYFYVFTKTFSGAGSGVGGGHSEGEDNDDDDQVLGGGANVGGEFGDEGDEDEGDEDEGEAPEVGGIPVEGGDEAEDADIGENLPTGNLIFEQVVLDGEEVSADGSLFIAGEVMLSGKVENNGVSGLVFEHPAVEEYVGGLPEIFLDYNCDDQEGVDDFQGFVEDAAAQLYDVDPDSVLVIELGEQMFDELPDETKLVYDVPISNFADAQTIFIVPENMEQHAGKLKVNLSGTLNQGMFVTVVVAGDASLGFTTVEPSKPVGEEVPEYDEFSTATLLVWGKASIIGSDEEASLKYANLNVFAHGDLALNIADKDEFNLCLSSGGDTIVYVDNGAHAIINPALSMVQDAIPLFGTFPPFGAFGYAADNVQSGK